MNNVILASASPRRQQLLKEIFEEFIVMPSNVDESIDQNTKVNLVPQKIAEKKAQFIAKDYPDSLVIGCDTAVIVDNIMLGKPRDKEDAFDMIKMLQGREHKVITGCALFYKGEVRTFSCTTLVIFNPLTDEDIENYLKITETLPDGTTQYQWADKAGAYGIQNCGDILVQEICGDFNNVVGLPCHMLKEEINLFLQG